MTRFYSPTTNTTYLESIHSDIPSDATELPEEIYNAVFRDRPADKIIVPGPDGLPMLADPEPPTIDELIAANEAAIQVELDRRAHERGYDNIVSACSYAAQEPGAPFQAEGAAYLAWRSAVWAQAYAVLEDVQAGKVPMPTPEEAVAQMPPLDLP